MRNQGKYKISKVNSWKKENIDNEISNELEQNEKKKRVSRAACRMEVMDNCWDISNMHSYLSLCNITDYWRN